MADAETDTPTPPAPAPLAPEAPTAATTEPPAPETPTATEPPVMPKPRDYAAERARAASRKSKNPPRAKPADQLKHPNKAWTPEHRQRFQQSMKLRKQQLLAEMAPKKSRAKSPNEMEHPTRAWTPERRKKFQSTMRHKAKLKAAGLKAPKVKKVRASAANGVLGAKPVGRPPKSTKQAQSVTVLQSDGTLATFVLTTVRAYVKQP